MSGHDIRCPRCGSIDVCQDYIDLRPVKTYGWVCDRCGHTWDVEPVTDERRGWPVIGMHQHDGYKPHSHEVRADHLGVEVQPGTGPQTADLIIPWSEVREGDQVLHAGQLHTVAEVWQSFPGGLSVVMPDASKIDVAVPDLLTAVRRKQ